MRRFTRTWKMLMASVFLVLAVPTIASAVDLVSIPATASSGVSFTVVAESFGEGVISLRATKADQVIEFAADVPTTTPEGELRRFTGTITLPSGGDWRVVALQDGDSSDTYTVSCDPGDYRFSTKLSSSKVTYATPAVFLATITHPDGSPLANTQVELVAKYPGGSAGSAKVVRTLSTDASGSVTAKVSNRGTWFGWIPGHVRVYDALSWGVRVPTRNEMGSATSAFRATKVNWLMNKPTPDFVTGKVKLVKNRRYQFTFWTANEGFEPGYFTITALSGKRYLNYDIRMRDLLGAYKTFSVPKTGTYRWRITGVKTHSCAIGIW